MSLYQLIYTSAPTRALTAAELEMLLVSSREANQQNEVTGMLVCFADSYTQLIEGPRPAVIKLYNNIVNDARHEQVITLKEGWVNKRFFPDWAMGFDKEKYTLTDYRNTFHLLDDDLSKLLDILYRN